MPARQSRRATAPNDSTSPIGIHESELWSMADALRGSMDAAEYKHVVLGLIFLKYISDAFEERHAAVLAEWGEEAAEDPDEYTAEAIFWVPPEARWGHLRAHARQPTIGQTIDDAMVGVERDNPALKDVLPKDYARASLDKQRLGQLIDMVGNIAVGDERRPRQRRPRARLRVLPRPVRGRRRQEGRRVLHAPLRRQAPSRDVGTVFRPGVRPVLRFVGHVRAIRRVHRCPCDGQRERWSGTRRHLDLGAGVELHHLAARPNEPRHTRHRRPDPRL